MSRRQGILLCYPFEEKRLSRWDSQIVLVQPKLDGERCRAILEGPFNDPILLSSEAEVKNFAVPHLVRELKRLALALGFPIELDGELYLHGEDFEEIHSVVSRTKNLHPLHERIEYHVFDIVRTHPQHQRIRDLLEIAKLFPPHVKLVPTRAVEDLNGIRKVFDEYVGDGYEGIIVRHIDGLYVRKRSVHVMKFKPAKQDIYQIIGYVEGKGKYSGTIGAIECRGNDGSTFEVGSFSMTDEERNRLWNMRGELTRYACKVGYQHMTGKSGVPKSAVFLELEEYRKTFTIESFNMVEDVNPLL